MFLSGTLKPFAVLFTAPLSLWFVVIRRAPFGVVDKSSGFFDAEPPKDGDENRAMKL